MKIPSYARYDYCNKKACEFLEEYNINSFPVNVEEIIQRNKWGLVRYSEMMEHFHLERQEVIRYLGSRDGFTILDGCNYTISFNDDDTLGNRTRFTLMHEIGHIYLNHLTDFESTKIYRGSLTKVENRVLENEANAFARNVLVPTSMLQQLKIKKASNVATHFGITLTAAQTRLDFFETDKSQNQRLDLLNRLKEVFYRFYYKKLCPVCGYHTVSKEYRYCPICGSKTLQWGDGEMIYEKLETHVSGKLKICPICQNEETSLDGEYCQICGTSLTNVCSDYDCEAPLPSNARFCPHCGNRSRFYNSGILKAWNQNEELPFTPFFSSTPVIEEIDEGLPFD